MTMWRVLGTVGVLCAWLAVAVAQEGGPAPVPKLTADELVMVQSVLALGKVANSACQELEAVQAYNAALQRTQARIEANHAGLSINWQTVALVAKAAPQAKAK